MLVGGLLTVLVGAVIFLVQGNDFQAARQANHFLRAMSDPISVVATVAGGLAILWKSRSLPRAMLSDGSPVGAAWTVGTSKRLLLGLGAGTILGVARAVPFEHQAGQVAFGPIQAFAALVLAPPLEELLFRGLLFGGYCRSFGPVWAALLTTILFWIPHIGNTRQPWLTAIGVTGMALTALWFRLRSAAVGPAVAVHLGYNAAVVAAIFCHNLS